jgi:phosphoglycerate kinase
MGAASASSAARSAPARPFVADPRRRQVSDKISVIDHLLGAVDALLVGGGMANTFLRAEGRRSGRRSPSTFSTWRTLRRQAGDKLVLPRRRRDRQRVAADAPAHVSVDDVPPGWRILDVGPRTLEAFAARLRGARTVVWNGRWASSSRAVRRRRCRAS